MSTRRQEEQSVRRRPYLTGRRCGHCLVLFEITEHQEGGWLFATYACPKCGNRTVVTFSPAELAEWARRSAHREARV